MNKYMEMFSDFLPTRLWFEDEQPQRKVYLEAFYIDKYEVTNAQYKKFVDATGHRVPSTDFDWGKEYSWENGTYPPGKANYPVVLVSWEDANVYAKWAGKRLPTEAEWEKAVRGTDRRIFPWGDIVDSNAANVNLAGTDVTVGMLVGKIVSVGSYENDKSPYGVYGMGGNVTEWVNDWYDRHYYKRSLPRNPKGPISGNLRVLRGGSYYYGCSFSRGIPRCSDRDKAIPILRNNNIGFRCAKDVPDR